MIIRFLKKAHAVVSEDIRGWLFVHDDIAYITNGNVLLKHYVGDIFKQPQPFHAIKTDVKKFLRGEPLSTITSQRRQDFLQTVQNVTTVPKNYVSAPFEESLISFDKEDAGKRPVMNLAMVNKVMALFSSTVTVSHHDQDFQIKAVLFEGKSKFGHDLTVALMPERMY